MPRKAKPKLEFGEKTKELFASVEATLSERGQDNVNLGELIEAIVVKNSASIQGAINSFVVEKTPMEYKVRKLLESEVASREINKLAQKHDFGLSPGT